MSEHAPVDTGSALGNHRASLSDLDEIAGGRLTPDAEQRILAAEHSRRMLLVRAVTEAAESHGAEDLSPLPSLRTAVALLVRAERESPEAVAALLDHPGTGVWAVRMLKLLGSSDRPDGEGSASRLAGPRLWEELGYLHCLAASAVLRAAVPARVHLPVRAGGVALPTLGWIDVPPTASRGCGTVVPRTAMLFVPPPGGGPAVLTVGGRQLALPADLRQAHGAWQPLSTVSWVPGGQRRALLLDDRDPYRDFRASPAESAPRPLTGPDAQSWRRLLREAEGMLSRRHPQAAQMVSVALRVLVPLPRSPRFRIASATFNEAFGCALISLPPSALELAVTMVHEARHSTLNGLLHQFPLWKDPAPGPNQPLFYAPWRGDPRPGSGLLHGAYAFAGVRDFWAAERHALTGPTAELAHFEFAVWREAVTGALRTLRNCADLTVLGRRFIDRMTEEAAGLSEESIPARPRVLAQDETADLWAVWRARHTRPPSDQMRLLTRWWLRGGDPDNAPGIRSQLRADFRFQSPHMRGELRRLLLTEPDALPAHARSDATRAARHPALVAADLALLTGQADRAAAHYRKVVAEQPQSPAAWPGLGLALSALDCPPAARALLHRPEVVRALHRQVSTERGQPPDPVGVADWVGRISAMYTHAELG